MSKHQAKIELNLPIYALLIPCIYEVINYLISDAINEDMPLPNKAKTNPFKLILIGETELTLELKNRLLAIWHKQQISVDTNSNTDTNIATEDVDNLILNNNNTVDELNIDVYSISEFLQLTFDKRYDLGVFIHPEVFNNELEDEFGSKLSKQLYKQSSKHSSIQTVLEPIAIRLRDLFSEQSLVFLPTFLSSDSSNSAFNSSNKNSGRDGDNLTDLSQRSHLKLNDLGYSVFKRLDDQLLLDFQLLDEKTETTTATQTPYPAHPSVTCWQFNLYDYKPRPDWLNAKYWANPENFDKFRW